VEVDPTPQAEHTVVPSDEIVPAAQGWQLFTDVAPTPEKNFPAGQLSQYVDATRSVYFPPGQYEHEELINSVEYLPKSHQ
jgi:hypothetical protein